MLFVINVASRRYAAIEGDLVVEIVVASDCTVNGLVKERNAIKQPH